MTASPTFVLMLLTVGCCLTCLSDARFHMRQQNFGEENVEPVNDVDEGSTKDNPSEVHSRNKRLVCEWIFDGFNWKCEVAELLVLGYPAGIASKALYKGGSYLVRQGVQWCKNNCGRFFGRKKRDARPFEDRYCEMLHAIVFTHLDKDNDNRLTLSEVWNNSTASGQWFEKHDLDGDAIVQPFEFNPCINTTLIRSWSNKRQKRSTCYDDECDYYEDDYEVEVYIV